MGKKIRKPSRYIVFPIIFFLVFVVYFGISVVRHKVGESNGVVDVPKEAQTIEFMELSIGAKIYVNEDELDQAVPLYFYIGGEWFEPDKLYPFTVWSLDGNTVFEAEDVVERFTWTYEGEVSDDVFDQMIADLSVNFGPAEEVGDTYTWTSSEEHPLGLNDKCGAVVLTKEENGVSVMGSLGSDMSSLD